MEPLHYSHTQISPLRYGLLVVILLSLAAGWIWRADFWVWLAMLCIIGVSLFLLLTMTTLTVEDEEDTLWVHFGPLPLFSTWIRFDKMQSFQATRSRIIDGWGIHYIPGRGWTWSLWGFECVEIQRQGSPIRLGTNDSTHLAEYLKTRKNAAKQGEREA